jgi:hypothetical protein
MQNGAVDFHFRHERIHAPRSICPAVLSGKAGVPRHALLSPARREVFAAVASLTAVPVARADATCADATRADTSRVDTSRYDRLFI